LVQNSGVLLIIKFSVILLSLAPVTIKPRFLSKRFGVDSRTFHVEFLDIEGQVFIQALRRLSLQVCRVPIVDEKELGRCGSSISVNVGGSI
jgi:hypothetical protein